MANTKILVVENTASFDCEIEKRLKNLGYTVCTSVTDGEQAIERVPELQIDLVMVNIGLEGAMAAVEAAKEIYFRFNVPVICLIDSIEKDVLERIKEAKVLGHIFKPFDANQLCLGIEQQLHWYELIHTARESDERKSTILNSAGNAVIAADREGLITFMNPVAESLTGWEMEEATGKQVANILNIYAGNADNLKKKTFLIEALQKVSVTTEELSSASEVNRNACLITKSGREIPIDYNITPIKDGRQTPPATL